MIISQCIDPIKANEKDDRIKWDQEIHKEIN